MATKAKQSNRKPERVGWEPALESFLTQKLQRSGSQGTVTAYRRLLARFMASVEGKAPDDVTPDDVYRFCYREGTPSAATISLRLAAVGSFYRSGQRMRYWQSNPADAIDRPRSEPPGPVHCFTLTRPDRLTPALGAANLSGLHPAPKPCSR